MLLLIAIHFHSGQLAAVGELVCATLGMRVPVRPNGLARIKQAFTQEIFTEQVHNFLDISCPRGTRFCKNFKFLGVIDSEIFLVGCNRDLYKYELLT